MYIRFYCISYLFNYIVYFLLLLFISIFFFFLLYSVLWLLWQTHFPIRGTIKEYWFWFSSKQTLRGCVGMMTYPPWPVILALPCHSMFVVPHQSLVSSLVLKSSLRLQILEQWAINRFFDFKGSIGPTFSVYSPSYWGYSWNSSPVVPYSPL